VLQYDEAAERQSSVKTLENTDDSNEAPDSDGGLVAGIVVGVLAAVLLVTGSIVAAVYLRRRHRQQTTASDGTTETCFVVIQKIMFRFYVDIFYFSSYFSCLL